MREAATQCLAQLLLSAQQASRKLEEQNRELQRQQTAAVEEAQTLAREQINAA